MSKYSHIITSTPQLGDALWSINRCEHKIIAVTQHGNTYTIFYEIGGNRKENPS